MRTLLIATAAFALVVTSSYSRAEDSAVPGTATGVIAGGKTGPVAGGPLRTAAEANLVGTVGTAVAPAPRDDIVIEQRSVPLTRERTCIRDALGNTSCEQPR